MHDLLRAFGAPICLLATAVLFAGPGIAEDLRAPSFNCDRAKAGDEIAICNNYSLAWLDRQLDRAWQEAVQRAGSSDVGEMLKAQNDWLTDRRKCAEKAVCLQTAYLTRLQQLSASKRTGPNLTGAYTYQAAENSGGNLSLVHHDDDTLAGGIETVNGATSHLCNVHFEAAQKIGDSYLWTGPRDEAGYNGAQCQVLLQPAPATVKIDSLHCNYYCGVSGTFDALYKKTN